MRVTPHTTARRRVATILAAAVLGTLAMLPVPAHAAYPTAVCATELATYNDHRLPVGKFICDWKPQETYYNGGFHIFVVGSTYNVYHTWTKADGSWTAWQNLGGTARSNVLVETDSYSTTHYYLELTVMGTDNNWYCKIHNGRKRANDWWPSVGGWSARDQLPCY